MKAFLLVVVVFFLVWDLAWLLAGVGQTLPWKLRGWLGEASRPQLLDVRTRAEFALFHIPGAVNRPDALLADPAGLGLDPDRPVVVVCLTGHRSPLVARRLHAHGLARATNLTWGMLGWLISGGRVVSGR
jgi:rhodanese-related sulfurtransferase